MSSIVLDIKDEKLEKKFRLQTKLFMLTYKTHLNKEKLGIFLKDVLKNFKISDFLISHETADDVNPYFHTHVVVQLEKEGGYFQSINPRIFDFDNIHPNIKDKIKGKNAFTTIWNYICKEDNKDKLIKVEIFSPSIIWDSKDKKDALEKVKRFSDVNGALTLWNNRPKPKFIRKVVDVEKLYEWQRILRLEMFKEPDPRKIIWMWEKVGNTGKTEWGKVMTKEFPDRWIMIPSGKYADMACLVKREVEKGWGMTENCGIVINIPRTAEGFCHSFYAFLEGLKDGLILSSKYDSESVEFYNPHVIVMSNFPPAVEKLSGDRWSIRSLPSVSNIQDARETSSLRDMVIAVTKK